MFGLSLLLCVINGSLPLGRASVGDVREHVWDRSPPEPQPWGQVCHSPVLELSRWRLLAPEVPSVVTMMAAVMSQGGSKAGPGFCMDQIKGRNKSGVFGMEATMTQK